MATTRKSKRDDLLNIAIEMYRKGHSLTRIAEHLNINRKTVRRWFDQVDVKPGMMVERGGLIGTIGATGRATGPHLDWRIDWQGRRIDPGLLVGAMPDPAS